MRALQRVASILESVAVSHAPATPARVCTEVGLSLSTTSRIMRELAEDRLLDKLSDGSYTFGSRLFGMVRKASESADPVLMIQRILSDLRDETGETASLHVRRSDKRVCIASAESRQELRRVVPVGDSIDLVGTATGDVLLAEIPATELTAALVGLKPSVRSREEADLSVVREQGWSVKVDGLVAGVTGLAVPVHLGSDVVAALTLSVPTVRYAARSTEIFVPLLRSYAERVSPWLEGR